jgi:hypothetical protein
VCFREVSRADDGFDFDDRSWCLAFCVIFLGYSCGVAGICAVRWVSRLRRCGSDGCLSCSLRRHLRYRLGQVISRRQHYL